MIEEEGSNYPAMHEALRKTMAQTRDIMGLRICIKLYEEKIRRIKIMTKNGRFVKRLRSIGIIVL